MFSSVPFILVPQICFCLPLPVYADIFKTALLAIQFIIHCQYNWQILYQLVDRTNIPLIGDGTFLEDNRIAFETKLNIYRVGLSNRRQPTCIQSCKQTHTHTHTHTLTPTRARAHTHTRWHQHTRARARTHTHTRPRTHTHNTPAKLKFAPVY